MRLHVYLNDTLYSDAVLHDSLEIRKDISDRMSTARATFKITGGDVARYDEAQYDEDVYGIDVRELYEVRIEDDGGNRHFAGQISRIEKERKSSSLTFYNCDLTDYTWILEQTVVPLATFTGQSDRAILQSLINTYAPQISALTANVAQIASSVGYFEVRVKSLRQAIEELCELTGGEWRVDYDKAFRYFVPNATPAPFSLSSEPDNVTSFGIDAFTGYARDFIRPVNRCTVIGGLLPGGTRLTVTYDDPVSQSIYGVRATTIEDENILIGSDAILRAKALVDQYAYPQETITLTTFKDGLEVGQSLTVFHGDYNISGQYIIRSITVKQEAKGTLTRYSLSLGARQPDALRLLRQLEARTRRNTQVPVAVPGPGSVTDGSIGVGGLSTSHLIGTITGSNVSVNAANVIGTLSGNDVVVDAGTIQGVITGNDVAVDVTTFQGAIISSQVADNLIDRLSLLSEPLRWIPNLASDPALPDPNYPVGAFYRRTGDNQFRKNVAGSWTNATESEAISGKLAFHSIGTIKAGSIIGLIAAGQIASITAGQITGLITASQITSVNASAITGAITASQISTVNASAIQGTITSTQIGSVAASTITGTITASQIGSVNASAITGTITSSQIASVNASSISGTITSTQIGSINAGTITIGQIQNSQINSVSASKLTAGTIDASVITVTNINASNITTGSMAADRLTAGTANIGAGGITFTGSGTINFNNTGGIGVAFGTLEVFSNTSFGGNVQVDGEINTSNVYKRNGTSGATGMFNPNVVSSITVSGGIIVGWS